MKVSAGIAIIYDGKILIAHPSRASWFRTYTPPKGGIEIDEESVDTAIRETFEDIGIRVKKKDLKDPVKVPYLSPKKKIYKSVILYPLVISSLQEIGLKTEKVPISQLQLDEVDDARFMTPEEFKERVLPRYYEPLRELVKKYSSLNNLS